jgi:hypothetical protein
MPDSQQYAAFEAALKQRAVVLRTTTEAYHRSHELPEW